jgi:hypothetical protein
MRFRPWLVLVSGLCIAAVVQAAPPEPAIDNTHRVDITTAVRVFVYSTQANLSAGDERTALDVASEVLSTASVDVVWTVCVPGTCLTPMPAAFKVRIVPSREGREHEAHLLGHALINSQTGAGELATVFIDRTRRLAGDLGIDHRVLLGRTIAHELGHLLLATPTHGNGLMREVWSRDELLGARRTDWVFDPHDADAIRARLASRGSGRSPGAS